MNLSRGAIIVSAGFLPWIATMYAMRLGRWDVAIVGFLLSVACSAFLVISYEIGRSSN